MRIGIVPSLNRSWGGVNHSLTMLHALDDWSGNECKDEFVVFSEGAYQPSPVSCNGRAWAVKPLVRAALRQQTVDALARIVGEGPHREAWRWLRRRLQRAP